MMHLGNGDIENTLQTLSDVSAWYSDVVNILCPTVWWRHADANITR